MRRCAAALAFSLLLGAAADVRADDRDLAEPLTIAGTVIFASSYAFTGATTTTIVIFANRRDWTIAQSWMPLVGPWIMLADSSGFNALQLFASAASGVLQAGSLAMIIAGLVLENQPADEAPEEARLELLPLAGPGALGLTARGRF